MTEKYVNPHTEDATKLFECVWTDGYPDCWEIHPLSFFSEDIGYDLEHIDDIGDLKVGDMCDLSDLSGTHTVTRIA